MTTKQATEYLKQQIRPGAVLKALAWLAGGFLLMAGFDFETPRRRFDRIDSTNLNQDTAIATVARGQLRSEEHWRIWSRLTCLDSRYKQRDLQLVGLNCEQALQGVFQAGQRRTP